MQSAQFRFDYPQTLSHPAWAVVQITQETDYIFTVSAWVENKEYVAFDALYGFLDGYVFKSHGGQVCFDCMADAIGFVRDAMRELGFTIKQAN